MHRAPIKRNGGVSVLSARLGGASFSKRKRVGESDFGKSCRAADWKTGLNASQSPLNA